MKLRILVETHLCKQHDAAIARFYGGGVGGWGGVISLNEIRPVSPLLVPGISST